MNSENRKNVLWIVMDQMREDCFSPRLTDKLQIPNLRKFQTESATFANHYAVTSPCGPSRASLHTGMYAFNHGSVRNGTPLANHHQNIAKLVGQAGWEPLLFGFTDTSVDPTGLPADNPRLFTYEGLLPGFIEKLSMRYEDSAPWREYLSNKGYDLPLKQKDYYRPVAKDGKQN